MTRTGLRDEVVAAARSCIGTRFRPQGRLIGIGLDCVGVVLVAAAAAGVRPDEVPAYALSGQNMALLLAQLRAAGCEDVHGVPAAGDIGVLAPGAGRLHLGVLTGTNFVHAHAGLGRVVEGPIDEAWRWLGTWRLRGVS